MCTRESLAWPASVHHLTDECTYVHTALLFTHTITSQPSRHCVLRFSSRGVPRTKTTGRRVSCQKPSEPDSCVTRGMSERACMGAPSVQVILNMLADQHAQRGWRASIPTSAGAHVRVRCGWPPRTRRKRQWVWGASYPQATRPARTKAAYTTLWQTQNSITRRNQGPNPRSRGRRHSSSWARNKQQQRCAVCTCMQTTNAARGASKTHHKEGR